MPSELYLHAQLEDRSNQQSVRSFAWDMHQAIYRNQSKNSMTLSQPTNAPCGR